MTSHDAPAGAPPRGSDAAAASGLDSVYRTRFGSEIDTARDAMWSEICRFLQRYVDPSRPILDVACDRGDFIRNIDGAERWAVDVRDVGRHLGSGVRFVQCDAVNMDAALPHHHFGTVFMSNYLEHLPDGDQVLRQLRSAHQVLRAGGRIVILQPNIRLVGAAYWDFLDHQKALTERSLVEAAESAGFRTEHLIKRFLPYTTRSRIPQAAWLVRWYLAMPPAWLLMGKQSLYVGRKAQRS